MMLGILLTIIYNECMLQNLCVWILMFLLAMVGGLIIQTFGVYKHNNSFIFIFITGFSLLIVYAQIYSIFFPIKSHIALMVLLLFYLIVLFINKKRVKEYFKHIDIKNKLKEIINDKETYIIILISLCIVFVTLLSSSQLSYETDDYLYHCQAVRWIEELGTIKGSGLINSRISFNSSIFCVFALFGFRDVLGYSLHAVIGFVVCVSEIALLLEFYKKKNNYAFCCFAIQSYYILSIKQSIGSFNTDIIPNIFVFCLAEMWLNSDNDYIKADLCMFTLIIATAKLSYALLAILIIFPLISFIKKKEYKTIVFYMICGLIVFLPYIVRNYYISGWILYPFTGIDIFNVVWKVPYKWAKEQADWVYAWARRGSVDGIEAAYAPFGYWFPLWWEWFADRNTKILLIAWIVFSVYYAIVVLYKLLKKKKIETNLLSISIVLLIENIYWLVSAPDVRFTFAAIYLYPIILFFALPFVSKITKYFFKKKFINILLILIVVFYLIKGYRIYEFNIEILKSESFYHVNCREIKMSEKITIYYPDEGKGYLTGNDFFPGGEYHLNILELEPLGDEIKDGFKVKDSYIQQSINE